MSAIDTATMRLRDWYQHHFVILFHADAQPGTIESYLGTINHWERLTDNPPLNAIDQLTVARFRNTIPGTADNRAKHCRQLNAMFAKLGPPGPRNRDALAILHQIPWARPPKTFKKKKMIPTDNELDAFMRTAKPDLQLFMVTAACTGARQTAVRMLSATRVDARALVIRYDAATDKRHIERLKPIPEIVLTWWRRWGHESERWKIRRNSFNQRWRRTLTKINAPHLTPHSLKRWWAARLIRHGANQWTVQYALDHVPHDVTGMAYLEPFDQLAELVNQIPLPTTFMEVPTDVSARLQRLTHPTATSHQSA
jgi:integrase